MKKLIFVGLVGVMLLGCEPKTEEVSANYNIPEGLKDCKVYTMDDNKANRIRVVRCHNSTTSSSYVASKKTVNTVVIDGVEYKKVEK